MTTTLQAVYGAAAEMYWDLGWRGVIPLPRAKKDPPPIGFTGHHGIEPSYPDILEWKSAKADGNIALRLPDGIIGIDVDAYNGKTGALTLAEAEKRWGALPRAPRTTSRTDNINGIRLYRVPTGLSWPNGIAFPKLGLGHIEVVWRGHRYAICWPSIHDETLQMYRWLDADGNEIDAPRPEDLPELPAAWVEALSLPLSATVADDIELVDVGTAFTEGQPEGRVLQRLDRALADLDDAIESRHDATCRSVLALLRFGQDGDSGVGAALKELRDAFVHAVTTTGKHRTPREANAEFDRFITNHGVAVHLSDPSQKDILDAFSTNGTVGPGPDPVPVGQFATEDAAAQSESGPVGSDAPKSPGPEAGSDSDPKDRVRGSGLYLDLAEWLAGDRPPAPTPSVLKRTDGRQLFYRSQVNWLFSDPEAGKTFIALAAIVETLIGGGNALFIDLDHNGADAIIDRLLMMGVDLSILVNQNRFRYCEPDEPALILAVVADVAAWSPAVIVVDSVGELIPLFGRDSNSADDFTKVHTKVLKPLAKTGAAVIAIDHMSKSADSRAHGAGGTVAKRRAVGGVSLRVKPMRPFTPDHGGAAMLLVHKDRHGGLRRWCPVGEREPVAGTFVIKSRLEIRDGELCWHINAPKQGERAPGEAAEPELVARIAEMEPPPTSIEDARKRLGVKKDRAAAAFNEWKATQHNNTQQEGSPE